LALRGRVQPGTADCGKGLLTGGHAGGEVAIAAAAMSGVALVLFDFCLGVVGIMDAGRSIAALDDFGTGADLSLEAAVVGV